MPNLYNTRFRITFNNDINELIDIRLDYLDYVGDVQNIQADGSALTIKSTGGDENKEEQLLGSEADIRLVINVGDNVSIDDFVAQHDLDVRVTIFLNKNYDLPIYQGFIVVEDNSQQLIDPPFTISLRAVDGLGFLKNAYLLDTDGNPFSGRMSIIDWLVQIIYNTGLSLKIRTYFNLSHPNFLTNINPLEQIFIDAQTFETGQQTPVGDTNPADFSTGFDDCYTALEKIVRNFRCKLFQDNGCFHLVNLYEYLRQDGTTYYEYTIGDPINGKATFINTGTASGIDYSVPVGKAQIVAPINEDAQIYLKLATKSIELTYNYDQSLNKICNQDLSQGVRDPALDEIISSEIIDPTINGGVPINLNTQAYTPGCFTELNGHYTDDATYGPYPSSPSTATDFIRVVLDQLGYNLTRFLIIKNPGVNKLSYLRSTRIYIDIGDIFQLSFSWRTYDVLAANARWGVAYVLLYGDDGTFWAMESIANDEIAGNPCRWFQTDSNFIAPGSTSTFGVSTAQIPDTQQWTDVQVNINALPGTSVIKAPASGQIEILFIQLQNSPNPPTEYWYKDISVTILPYLQGAYKQLKGDYNYGQQTNNIRQIIQEEVEISDSPKRYFKGALVDSTSALNLLSPQWSFPSGVSGAKMSFRFTEAMLYILYNHFYRVFKKIEGTFKGMVYNEPQYQATRAIGMLNSYYFPDTASPTKRYMMTSFEKDYTTAQFRGVFVETRKDINELPVFPPDLYIFDYLFQTS